MDLHLLDANGNHFVVPDAPEGYERDDATAIDAPPSSEHRWIDGDWKLPAEPEPAEDAINAERERRILTGTTVEIAGIGPVPLQGRPEDQINLLALKDTARDLKAAGVSAPVIPFRDGNNVIHMMTPDQMIEATDKGKLHVSAVYQAAWDLKAMEPIPADFADDKWWP
jgi:hypothetical protein